MTAPVDAWGIVELFGHRKVAGRIREAQHFGESMCCIDVPDDRGGDGFRTQMYGGKAIFGVHLTTETEARAAAKHCSPAPFSWLLDRPQLGVPTASSSEHTSAGHRRAIDADGATDAEEVPVCAFCERELGESALASVALSSADPDDRELWHATCARAHADQSRVQYLTAKAPTSCGACDKPLGDQFVTVDVDHEIQLWHRDCAEEHAAPAQLDAVPASIEGGA